MANNCVAVKINTSVYIVRQNGAKKKSEKGTDIPSANLNFHACLFVAVGLRYKVNGASVFADHFFKAMFVLGRNAVVYHINIDAFRVCIVMK